jgi:hypothetical protein
MIPLSQERALTFHRTTALAAGTFAGLAAAITFAAPASASATVPVGATATLTSSVSCTTGGWQVSWNLRTARTDGAVGVFSNVKSSIPEFVVPPGGGLPGRTPPDLTPPPLKTFVDGGKVTGDAELTEDQPFLPPAVTVELKLTVTWPVATDGRTATNLRATATAPDCRGPEPSGPVASPPPLPSFEPDEADTDVAPPSHFTAPASPAPSPSVTTSAAAPATAGPSRTTEAAGIGGADRGGADSGGEDSGGGLALTGAAAGSLGGGAALLALAGAALFGMARRRRMKFTA